jgi:phosphoglycerate dehydrogenase-like enzyme
VVITPHTAYDTVESTLNLRQEVANTAVAILKGEVPYNVVNKAELGLA